MSSDLSYMSNRFLSKHGSDYLFMQHSFTDIGLNTLIIVQGNPRSKVMMVLNGKEYKCSIL